MSTLHVTYDLLRHQLRRPLGWLLAILLLMSWPALRTFLPLGLVTADLHHWTGAYEVAFMGGVAAIVLCLGPLEEIRWMMRPVGPIGRISVQWTALLVMGGLAGSLALIPAHLFHDWQQVDFRAGDSLGALVVGWSHTAALAVCVLQLRLDPHLGAALVLGLVTVVPGSTTGEGPLGSTLLAWTDAGETLRTSFEFPLTGAHWIGAALPIFGWVACALACATPGAERGPGHALRDPR